MSHTVTVRTATVTTSTSALIINTGFMKTYRGALKLLELILGIVCVVLMVLHDYYNYEGEFFFMLMATTFMITTACLVLSCLLSISTDSILSKTIFEPIYHAVAFALLFAASVNFLVKVNNRAYRDKTIVLTAAILGTVNGVLYLFSAFLGSRTYRGL